MPAIRKKRESGTAFIGIILTLLFILMDCISDPSTAESVIQGFEVKESSTPLSHSEERIWRSATYHGLVVGKSMRKDMLRLLGKPKSTAIPPQYRITTNPNTIVNYHYGGPKGYGGNLVVGIEKTTGIIAWIESIPENRSRDEIIRQFGSDYVLTGYVPEDCFSDGQRQYGMLREAPEETTQPTYTHIEYRQLGVTIQYNVTHGVYRIIYLSDKWPFGNASSLCNQPKKRLAYIACGCGCCGGAQPKTQCLYRSKGDDLKTIVRKDKEGAKSPECASTGCAIGVKYVYCD